MTPTLKLHAYSVRPGRPAETERLAPQAVRPVQRESLRLAHRQRATIVVLEHFLMCKQLTARHVQLDALTLTDVQTHLVKNATSEQRLAPKRRFAKTALQEKAILIRLT